MTHNELRAGAAYVLERAEAIRTLADSEDRDMTDVERADFEAGMAYVEETTSQIERLATREAEIQRARDFLDAHPETETVVGDGTQIEGFNVNTRKTDDPFDLSHLGAGVERASQVRGRAIEAIERSRFFQEDDHKESATRIVERVPGVAEQVLVSSDPIYRSAFAHQMTDGRLSPQESAKMDEAMGLLVRSGFFNPDPGVERAINVSAVTAKLVPAYLDPSVILNNVGAANPFREISRVAPISTNVWTGVTSAGVNAEWTGAEGSEVADASPTFTNPAVTAYMWDAFVPLSFQAFEDWDGAESEITMMIADGKDRLEEAAFATGSGTNQPTGIITALTNDTTTQVTMTTSGSFGLVDFYALFEALAPRYRRNGKASFVMNIKYLDRIRQFGTANNYNGFTVDLTASGLTQVLGRPVYESTTISGTLSTASTYALVFGDWSNYLIADRVGTVVEFVPQLFGTTNGRPIGRRGWLAHGRTGGNTINNVGFKVLKTS